MHAYDRLAMQFPKRVSDIITSLHDFLGKNDMFAYLVMMGERLIELHRVLKPTGKSAKLFVVLIIAAFLFMACMAFNNVPKIHASGGGPSTVCTSTATGAVRLNYQDKSFYADGLFCVFYSDGTNMGYRTSSSGTGSWSSETTIRACTQGYYFSIYFDGTYVYYAYSPDTANTALYYRVGEPTSGGTITWLAAEQTAVAAGGGVIDYAYPTVTVDSNGYVWISYQYCSGSSYAYVTKCGVTVSGGSGAWSSTAAGFPYEISATAESGYYLRAVPLSTSGAVVVIYGGGTGNSLWIDQYTGSSWDSVVSTVHSCEAEYWSAVADGANVDIVYMTGSSFEFQYVEYMSSSNTLSSETTVESGFSTGAYAPAITLDPNTHNLYVFWEGYPTSADVYYAEYVYASSSWTGTTTWIAESTALTSDITLSSFYETYSGYIGLEYQTATSSPYNVRFAFLQLTAPPELSDSGITYSTTIGGASCTFSITATDTVALAPSGTYSFGTNITGTMSWTAPVDFTSALTQTVTETYTLPASGNTVAFAWDLTDNAANVLDTGTLNFLVVPATFTSAEAGITSASPLTEDQKPAVVNGNNYIVASTGGSFQNTYISVYSATSSWAPSTELATTSTAGYGDFYTFIYPSVLPNTIIICGNYQASMYGFIMEFNTNTNTFTNSEMVTDTGYVTQVYYISNLNEFVITEVVSGSSQSTYTDYLVTSTPSNLFTQANWVVSSQGYYLSGGLHEHRFAYDAGTGYGYIIVTSDTQQVWQINMNTWAGTEIWSNPNNPVSHGGISPAVYISSDGTNVYWSFWNNNGVDWQYYVYNGASVFNFATLPLISGSGEDHADIFPIGNGLILVGDIADGVSSGYYAIYQNLVQIASFVGPDTHFSDNHVVVDSLGNIIIGGENDLNSPTYQAELTVITPSNVLTNTITASSDGGSTISPSGSINALSGSTETFAISPDLGYTLSEVVVNGMNQGALTSYTFPDVSGSGTISVISAGEATVSITFTSSSATGSGFITVNSVAEATPYTISSAVVGSTYTITANTPANTVTGQSQYAFIQWSSTSIGTSSSASITYTVPVSGETVTASFQNQYYLTVTGGSSPTGQGWVNSGSATTASNSWVWGTSGSTRTALTNWQLDGTNQNPTRQDSGTLTTSSITMNTYHTVNFVSATQYLLTVNGGNSVSFGTASPTGDQWYDSGGTTTVSSNGIYSRSGGSGQRVASWNVDGGSNTAFFSTGTVTTSSVSMTTYHTVTFNSVTQYQVTLDSGATSALYSITSPTVSGDTGWYDSGTSVTLVLNGVYGRSGGSGTRVSGYKINAGSNNPESTTGTFTVLNAASISGVEAITTTTVTQYQITLDSGATSALYSITSPTVSSDNYWYDSGTSVSVVLTGVWDRSDGVGDRLAGYVLNGGSNNPTSTTGTVTVFSGAISNHEFVTATSVTQYQLTVTTNFGSISPATGSWYDSGSTVTVSATAPVAGSGEQYIWNGWSGTGSGSYTGTDNPATNEVTMNAPITEAASWTHQFQIIPSADANSVISPSSSIWVNAGASPEFTYSANIDCSLATVTVDGSLVSITGSYTFTDVTAPGTIAITATENTPSPTPTPSPSSTPSPLTPPFREVVPVLKNVPVLDVVIKTSFFQCTLWNPTPTVTVYVTNNGVPSADVAFYYDIYNANNATVAQGLQTVYLNLGATKTLSLDLPPLPNGFYTVTVNAKDTQVDAQLASGNANLTITSPFYGESWFVLLAVGSLIVVTLILVIKRRNPQ
jgi:hypothetical protein